LFLLRDHPRILLKAGGAYSPSALPRLPAARFSSNRGRPNTRVELTEPTVRIAALPVGLHPASSAAAPASPVRIHGHERAVQSVLRGYVLCGR